MGTVIMHSVTSLDGYIADDHDAVGPLHDWYFNGTTPILPEPDAANGDFDHSGSGSSFRVSAASAEYVRGFWQSIGCIVMGRHLFDLVDGWEGRPPAGEHVVVVSHRPKPEGWHPEASYHFVDNVAEAIAVAQDLAGDRIVAVNAGRVGGQIFAAGLVDQVAMDVVPAVFGSGRPYFGDLDDPRLLEGPTVVVQGEGVLHTLYTVPSSRP